MSVFDLPDGHILRMAHRASIHHRGAIERSRRCGCFYCLRVFEPGQISDWIDQGKPASEQTALCPYCGIDSVMGDGSGLEITEGFLRDMKKHWFDAGSPVGDKGM